MWRPSSPRHSMWQKPKCLLTLFISWQSDMMKSQNDIQKVQWWKLTIILELFTSLIVNSSYWSNINICHDNEQTFRNQSARRSDPWISPWMIAYGKDIQGKRANPPYRPYTPGNSSQVIFRHGTPFFSVCFSRVAWMFSWRICLCFVSKQRKASNAVGMSSLIFD